MSASGICSYCGLSFKGEHKQLRLGTDEPPVLVKCACPTPGQVDTLVRDLIQRECKTTPVGDLEQRPTGASGICIIPESTSKHEYEITVNPRYISEDNPHERDPAFYEFGCAVSVRPQDEWMSARLRVRVSDEPANAAIIEEALRSGTIPPASTHAEHNIKYTLKDVCIAPGINMKHAVEYVVHQFEYGRKSDYAVRFREHKSMWGQWVYTRRYYEPDGGRTCEIEYVDVGEPAEQSILNILDFAMSFVLNYTSMKWEIHADVLKGLRHSARPVKDVKRIPQDGMVYRVKVDGEHVWVMEMGTIWFVCRNNPLLSVVSYVMGRSVRPYDGVGTVMRADQLVDGRLVLIDFIAESGTPLKILKRYDHYVPMYERVRGRANYVVVRKEYGTSAEANSARATCDLPSDGIVAIEQLHSVTYRVKKPTIDVLRVNESMCVMVANDPRPVCPVINGTDLSFTANGGIYECMVRAGVTPTSPPILYNPIRRYDKDKPNSITVFNNILSILDTNETDDLVLMDSVSIFSFDVRNFIYSMVSNSLPGSKLIIDVGTGRLQSQTIVRNHPDKSFIFCDPNIDEKAVIREFNALNLTSGTPQDIVKNMEGLIGKKRDPAKYAYYRGTIQSLMSHQSIVSFVRKNKVPLVYSFSLSYVSDFFARMNANAVLQIGCCYVYDNAVDGVLFDLGGLRFAKHPTLANMALARFGRKAQWGEPYVLKSAFGSRKKWMCTIDVLTDSDIDAYTRSVVRNILIVSEL